MVTRSQAYSFIPKKEDYDTVIFSLEETIFSAITYFPQNLHKI